MRRLIHQRLGKLGLPPGALVRTQDFDQPAGLPSILVIDYLPEELPHKQVTSIEGIAPFLESKNPTWIDISGNHPVTTYQKLGDMVGLHALVLEDMLNTDQRPKVEEYDDYTFIVLRKPTYNPKEKHLELSQVSILLTARSVISLHDHPPHPATPIRSRLISEQKRIRHLGTDYLAYVILDSIVDEYFVALESCEERIQDVEDELATDTSSDTMQKIYHLKQEIILMRRSVWPLREVIATLSKTGSRLFDEGIKLYLKDLQDHVVQIVELTDVYRDMITGMLDIYLSTVSHKTNQIVKTLTMVASVFIPLTLVTGIYGMNFTHMPELQWKYGYPMAIGIMVVIALGMLALFRRRKWL